MSHLRHRPSLRHRLVRALAALVTTGLAITLLGPPAGAAAPKTSPAGRGGTWLAGQLHHGLIHNGQFDVDDYGLTADTALALDAVGHHTQAISDLTTALAQHVDDYTTYQKDRYAGPTAKLLVVAEDNGASIHDFGGVDLVARLENRVSTTPPTIGRIQDKSAFGDFANTVGQVFAVRGLLGASSTSAPAALEFLLDQQCAQGYFRLDFTTDKTAADQGCTGSDAPDTDVTALAVVELWSVRDSFPELHAALDQAVAWLRTQQHGNGSFGGGPTTSAANSNSTGLAAWALGLAGRCTVAAKAAGWVRQQQVQGSLGGTPLAHQGGAVAYDHRLCGTPSTTASPAPTATSGVARPLRPRQVCSTCRAAETAGAPVRRPPRRRRLRGGGGARRTSGSPGRLLQHLARGDRRRRLPRARGRCSGDL